MKFASDIDALQKTVLPALAELDRLRKIEIAARRLVAAAATWSVSDSEFPDYMDKLAAALAIADWTKLPPSQ